MLVRKNCQFTEKNSGIRREGRSQRIATICNNLQHREPLTLSERAIQGVFGQGQSLKLEFPCGTSDASNRVEAQSKVGIGEQVNGTKIPSKGEELSAPLGSIAGHSKGIGRIGNICRECGSPLSDTGQFCWMCGAARDCRSDPRVELAPSRALHTDCSGAASGQEPELSRSKYEPNSEPAQIRRKRYGIGILLAIIMFLILLCVGYWQIRSGKALFGSIKLGVVDLPTPLLSLRRGPSPSASALA